MRHLLCFYLCCTYLSEGGGKWKRAWPYQESKQEYCYSVDTHRWGFNPIFLQSKTQPYINIIDPYPSDAYIGEPLQAKGIPIKAHMTWDMETGEPFIDKPECQQDDQPAAPPWACIMIIDSVTQDVLECSGLNAAIVC